LLKRKEGVCIFINVSDLNNLMEKEILAFADEYGNNSFDFTKQGTHFIVASILSPAVSLLQAQCRCRTPLCSLTAARE
jgi:hypothetical protein